MKMKNKWILPILLLWVIYSCFLCRDITVTVEYDAATEYAGLTTLYYDTGHGFEEPSSVYETIDAGTVQYTFSPAGTVSGLRIMPLRDAAQTVWLQSVTFSVDGSDVKTLEGEELYSAVDLDLSTAQVKYQDGLVQVEYKENQPWAYLTLTSPTLRPLNFPSWLTIAAVVLVLLVCIGMCWGEKRISGSAKPDPDESCATGVQKLLPKLVATMLILMWYSYACSAVLTQGVDVWAIDILIWAALLALSAAALGELLYGSRPWKRVLIRTFLTVVVSFALYEAMKIVLRSDESFMQVIKILPSELLVRMTSPVYLMNLFWGWMLLLALYGLCGNIGYVVYGVICLVLIIGNGIKIYYHDTLLTPIDFLQLEEMFRIADTVLGLKNMVLLGILIVALLVLAVVTHKKWLPLLKPSFHIWYVAVAGLLCVWMTWGVLSLQYYDRNIYYKGHQNEYINERDNGVVFYNMINLSRIDEIFMSEPENYSQQTVQQQIAEFQELKPELSEEVQPNVIVIMAESLFDIEGIDGLQFNSEIEPTLHQYASGELISPRYGGYTSAVEYEALTGLSLAFYQDGIVPYTTYFNSAEQKIPSVAWEFKKNGYAAIAMHPNDKTFYNRDAAYAAFGFDMFLDRTAFTYTSDNVVAGTFLKDMPVAEKITELIQTQEESVFVFATTIAGHYMSEDRYETTDIVATHPDLDQTDLHELEQAATAYRETDEMFRYLVEYLEQCEEPTLLYIFGDHLPPIEALSKLQYNADFETKYTTALSVYSNYKQIEIPQAITPNQLATQVIMDSGIRHSSYFDYIYSLRETYPVLHAELVDVDQQTQLDLYRMIQYDIMFGNQWFYEE